MSHLFHGCSLSLLSRVPTYFYLGIVRYRTYSARGPLFKIFTDDIIPENNLCNPQQFLYAIRHKEIMEKAILGENLIGAYQSYGTSKLKLTTVFLPLDSVENVLNVLDVDIV